MILDLTDVAVMFGMMATLLTPIYTHMLGLGKKVNKIDTRLQILELSHERIHKGD